MFEFTIYAPDPVRCFVPQSFEDYAELDQWLTERQNIVIGLDSETNALDPWERGFLCRAVQFSDGVTAWVVDVQHCLWTLPGGWLAALLAGHPRFVAHFSEAEVRFLGQGVPGSIRMGDQEPHIYDYQVPQGIVYPRTLLPQKDGVDVRLRWDKGLKPSYARHFCNSLAEAETALHDWFKENAPKGLRTKEKSLKWGFANVPFMQPEFLVYAAMDAVAVKRLWDMTVPQLAGAQIGECLRELDHQWDIDCMTYRGIPVDPPYVYWLRDQLDAVVEEESWHLGCFGIKPSGMGDAVGAALATLGAPVYSKTDGGAPQWNKLNLLKLLDDESAPHQAQDLAQHILDARRAGKFRVTYVEPMLAALTRDGRVRCGFRSIGTVTHRNSAYNPPLQQLPKKDGRVRAAFGGLPGWSVVSCDFAQGEPRVMAGLSGDPKYVAAVHSGDVNNVAAVAAFGAAFIAAEGKTSGTPSYLMRQATKAGFLSICYMAGVKKLAQIMGLPQEQVKATRANWHEEYSVMFGRAARLNRQEFVTLPSGRTIILWDRKIVCEDGSIITSAEPSRKGLNYETQGHQADLLKACWRLKLRAKWRSFLAFFLHDELMLLVPDALAAEAARDLQEAMTLYIGHGVVMECEATIDGRTWLPQPDSFNRAELKAVDDDVA
jgi:DNA polymerase-1